MDNVKISVIMPVRNCAAYIERAIRSVISQGYDNKELIIIDGASTDGTIDIIKRYEKDISFWVSEPDSGIIEAVSKALSKASGKLIGQLGADDWYEEGALSEVAKAYKENPADVMYGDLEVHEDGKSFYHSYRNVKLETFYYLFPIGTPATFVDKELILEDSKKETVQIAADYLLFLRAYHEGRRFSYVDTGKCLTHFSRGGVSSTLRYQTAWNHRLASYMVISDNKDLMDRYESKIETRFAVAVEPLYADIIGEEKYSAYIAKAFPIEKPCVAFGAGDDGRKTKNLLERTNADLICFVDNSKNRWGGQYEGLCVKAPSFLQELKEANIIIASYDYEDEIQKQLDQMNLDPSLSIIKYSEMACRIKDDFGLEILKKANEMNLIR